MQKIVRGGKFLTGALYSFPPDAAIDFFKRGGMPVKVERGNRAFPSSDKASDVTKCLEKYCKNAGVRICLDEEVCDYTILNSTVSDIITSKGRYPVDKIIVCTGGLSYPSTGSTGDGYKFALKAGHKIVAPVPSLCGLNISGSFCAAMQGLSLKNVKLTARRGGKTIFSELGEMLFTHFGISGPLALSLSSVIAGSDLSGLELSEAENRDMANCLKGLLPVSAVVPVLNRAGIAQDKKVNSVTRAERRALLTTLKKFDMIVTSLRGFEEAIITAGGVDLREISPKTMESKLVSGLYFCGEVLNVDAFTGGFNMHIAFATGFAAGSSIKP